MIGLSDAFSGPATAMVALLNTGATGEEEALTRAQLANMKTKSECHLPAAGALKTKGQLANMRS